MDSKWHAGRAALALFRLLMRLATPLILEAIRPLHNVLRRAITVLEAETRHPSSPHYATAADGSRGVGDQAEASSLQKFLAEAGQGYGYNGTIESIRKAEFRRLNGHVYLDHAGATLYSEAQVQAAASDLSASLHSNPHRWSSPSSLLLATLPAQYQVIH